MFWKYAANLQESTHFEGQFWCKATLLNSQFGMGVLLLICWIFSEHLFVRTPLEGCFCFLHHEILVCCFYFAHGCFLISLPCLFLSLPLSILVLFMLQKYFTINLFITCFFIFFLSKKLNIYVVVPVTYVYSKS